MVLSVCRRMLSGSADVEDAFQAVFFVLARKASALRRVEGLKCWLYGVAVRTAKEVRRRSTRLQRREGGVMDETRAVSPSNEDRGDLLDLLDEEIDRLPRRYREVVLLCELDGSIAAGRGSSTWPPRGDPLQPAGQRPDLAARSLEQTRCHTGGRGNRGSLRTGERHIARAACPLHSSIRLEIRGRWGDFRDGPGGCLLAGGRGARHDVRSSTQDDPDFSRIPGRGSLPDRRSVLGSARAARQPAGRSARCRRPSSRHPRPSPKRKHHLGKRWSAGSLWTRQAGRSGESRFGSIRSA